VLVVKLNDAMVGGFGWAVFMIDGTQDIWATDGGFSGALWGWYFSSYGGEA